ncbi:MAG: hypothetical protein L0Y54_19000, partial [Sporichthyaceae bacterium]|nr:hypothetical protein [Sporichthyaceae bacterium]
MTTYKLHEALGGPITVPGAYDIPADEYHADTSALSASGVRTLLASPARFRYDQTHPKPPSKAFDLGHAAHKAVLGAGQDVVVV